jgi:hypothetical protein
MIARVFPRRTEATPNDEYAFVGGPDLFMPTDITEVHISCAFTFDKETSERLAKEWEKVATVSVGGPAYDDHGGDFEPGKYIKKGYVVTSRGCPNSCWFCHAWKREGHDVRELPIVDGWNVLDSNLLACSEPHIRSVFSMLKKQPERAQFTGGLEPARLKDWHIDLLWELRPEQIFCAYDTPDDLEPLRQAGKLLYRADFTRRHCRCYVLIGHPKDTMSDAEQRLLDAWDAGFMPCAMLWSDNKDKEWKVFQRDWIKPAITRNIVRELVKVEREPEGEE